MISNKTMWVLKELRVTKRRCFSGEFCKIFKNTFFIEHHQATTSEDNYQISTNMQTLKPASLKTSNSHL